MRLDEVFALLHLIEVLTCADGGTPMPDVAWLPIPICPHSLNSGSGYPGLHGDSDRDRNETAAARTTCQIISTTLALITSRSPSTADATSARRGWKLVWPRAECGTRALSAYPDPRDGLTLLKKSTYPRVVEHYRSRDASWLWRARASLTSSVCL